MKQINLNVPFIKQPEEECAPTALAQVLKYYGTEPNLEEIIHSSKSVFKGREWDYMLGNYAISKGFNVKIHTRSLSIFDSTWFDLKKDALLLKLGEIISHYTLMEKKFIGYNKLLLEAHSATKFLKSGGIIDFSAFSKELIIDYLKKDIPVIATFTAQLLYKTKKEYKDEDNDTKGEPWKHTIVISGFLKNKFKIVDSAEFQPNGKYLVNINVFLDACIRYDSNLLVLYK